MREPSGKTPDRRQAPRTKLVEIAYIGMGPENGGLVLDVSDGGLSFHSVAPVRMSETINFLLSLRGHSRIEGVGEVVWTNAMKTVCGLRFTSLSAGAREYLNNWTNQSRMAAPARKRGLSAVPRAIPDTQHSPASLASAATKEADPVIATSPAPEIYLSEPTDRSVWREPFFFWIMFGILGTALAVTAFIYGERVGKSEIGSAMDSVTLPAPQADPQAPAPAAAPASPQVNDAPAVPSATPAVPSNSSSAQRDVPTAQNEPASRLGGTFVNASKTDSVLPNSFQRPGDEAVDAKVSDQNQNAEVALEAGKSELAAALASLRGANGLRDSAKAARLLWAAVQNNNSTAEVVLADLYLRGDGVAKSCEQGRVLLAAASKNGNVQGQEKLAELDANGCP